ncbi:MAG: PqqD family protein [Candidatus Acidiferrales bacterium]
MAVLGDLGALRVRRSSNVVSRVVADEAIVVPIRRGAADLDSIYTFNESGTKLWSMIENGLDAAALASYLQAEYGLSQTEALVDAEAFVKDLTQEGLVEPA